MHRPSYFSLLLFFSKEISEAISDGEVGERKKLLVIILNEIDG